MALNAEVRSGVIPNAAIPNAGIQSAVGRGATGAVRNVALNAVTRSVVDQGAMGAVQNAVIPNVVLNVVRDVVRRVVIPCAVTRSGRYAVDQRVADPDVMVGSQDEVLPNDGQGVSPVDLLNLFSVQSEGAPDAALFSVPARA